MVILVSVANGETERVAKGVINPFETSFKPLIEEMNDAKVDRVGATLRCGESWM